MEDKIRAFIAIELNNEIKRAINDFEKRLIAIAPSGLRWVKTDQLHLTLKFLGDISQAQSQQVTQSINHLVVENRAFSLEVEGTGVFPNWRNPRTLWIGMKKSNELNTLFQQMETELAALGFSPEGRPFTPHMTLCRVSDTVDPRKVQPLQKEFDAFPVSSLPIWNVSEMVFFKSQLQPGGPIYTPISRHVIK